jgi:hypothetical protein
MFLQNMVFVKERFVKGRVDVEVKSELRLPQGRRLSSDPGTSSYSELQSINAIALNALQNSLLSEPLAKKNSASKLHPFHNDDHIRTGISRRRDGRATISHHLPNHSWSSAIPFSLCLRL